MKQKGFDDDLVMENRGTMAGGLSSKLCLSCLSTQIGVSNLDENHQQGQSPPISNTNDNHAFLVEMSRISSFFASS